MPDVILFEDGQLLVRDEENISEKWFENQWYWETYLSQDEVLDLISQIEAEGFSRRFKIEISVKSTGFTTLTKPLNLVMA